MPKCPICGRIKHNKTDMINHCESEHNNEIPENMSTAQFIYFKVHGRDYGLCRVCGKPTKWNEKAGKPSQNCGSPECKAKIKEIAQKRMLKVYGKVSLMNDMKHQEKMLANRKISGVYIWSDHKHKFTYTGQYEKFAIEWLDKVMDLDPETIQMPGPIIPYQFEGETKYWITDIYLEDFNLIIEIKAGKDENTHPGFEHNRQLEAAKDDCMRHQNIYNYTKITHKTMMNLVKVLAAIREINLDVGDKEKEPVVIINESALNDNNEKELYTSNIKNSDIKSICENIINEYSMSVANINPIVTNSQFIDIDNKPKSLIDRLKNIKKNNEDIDPQSNIFSPNNTKEAPDPLDASNNFIENEEVRIDIENDPYDVGMDNFLGSISQDNTKSFFN